MINFKLTNTWKHIDMVSVGSLIYVLIRDFGIKNNGLDIFVLLMVLMVALVVEGNQYEGHGSKRGYWQRRGFDTVVDIGVSIGICYLIVFVSWMFGIALLMLTSPWWIKWIRNRING